MSRHTTAQPRRVDVAAERLPRWLEQFGQRHGAPVLTPLTDGWRLACPDEATAELHNRWPDAGELHTLDEIVTHLTKPRRLGLLLVRKGGHAVGISDGAELVVSKVDSSYVQGRTKAGGWSQQRYARRRDQQAAKAYQSAALIAAQILLPEWESIESLVCGGDAKAIDEVLADPRLVVLAQRRAGEVIPTVDPRLSVLQDFVTTARSVKIRLNEFA